MPFAICSLLNLDALGAAPHANRIIRTSAKMQARSDLPYSRTPKRDQESRYSRSICSCAGRVPITLRVPSSGMS